MIFDKLCGVVERHEELRQIGLADTLRDCKLFYVDIDPSESLPKEHDDDSIRFLSDDFFLPFPELAVEDRMGVVILCDCEESQRGLAGTRTWVCASWLLNPRTIEGLKASGDLPDNYVQRITDTFGPDGLSVCFGGVKSVGWESNHVMTAKCAATQAYVVGKSVIFPMPLDTVRSIGQDVLAAYQEVFAINTPSRFILETSSTHARTPKAGHLLRSVDRPLYTLLSPMEIRNRMHLPTPEMGGSKKMPHERRGHYRTLHSDRFVHKKGQTLLIPACWVGPSENVVGNRKYRVILD